MKEIMSSQAKRYEQFLALHSREGGFIMRPRSP